jgi:hypothetical protein
MMNKLYVWESAKSYTVLKEDGRVYFIGNSSDAGSEGKGYICSEREIDIAWMDRNQKRIEVDALPKKIQMVVAQLY